MLEMLLLLCKSYHHAKRRRAANHQCNQPHCNHLYLPAAVKRLSITVSDMQNRIQSQVLRVIISCQNVDVFFPQAFQRSIRPKTHSGRSQRESVGSLGVRITGIGRGGLRVSQKRASEEGGGGFPKPQLGEISREQEGQEES